MAKVQREWYSRGEFKNKTQTQCWGHLGMYHRFTHIADIIFCLGQTCRPEATVNKQHAIKILDSDAIFN
jgi:hypothetical protein